MKPSVRVIKQLSPGQESEAKALAIKLRAAVNDLDSLSAWPEDCGKFEITIVNAAPKTSEEYSLYEGIWARGMEVRWELVDTATLGRIQRDESKPIQIAVGVDLLRVGCAHALMRLGANESDVLLHLLAHEIHHLNESERLIECNVPRGDHRISLVKAIRKEFSDDWQVAIKDFAARHGPSKAIDLDDLLLTAGHIADEACADLIGLHWLREAKRDWIAFADLLIDFRESEAVASRAKNGKVVEYEVAPAIEAVFKQGELPTVAEIQAATMRMAIDMAMGSPKLDAQSRHAFSSLSQPLVVAKRQVNSRKSGFLSKLLGR